MITITEADVEQAAPDRLNRGGWSVAHGPDISPDTIGADRSDYVL